MRCYEVFMYKAKQISSKSKFDQRKGENWQKIQENNLLFWMAPRMIAKCKKGSPSARHILKIEWFLYSVC